MHERQRMLHDIHCVPDQIDDSAETENKALNDLNDWITKHYDTEEATAYRMAESISKPFVESRDLRLLFLRAVMDYDTEKAGARFLSHLTLKLELFGEAKLCRERITIKDLDENDMDALSRGFFQVLPIQNSAEQGVVFFNFDNLEYKTLANALRAIFYTTMAFYDVDFPKKGIAFLSLGLEIGNNMKYLGYQFLMQFAKLGFSVPIRVAGMHHCLAPGLFGILVKWFSALLPARARVRTRIHVGSHQENIHKLMSHGIPTRTLPAMDDTTLKADTQWHLEWIEIRKKMEAQYHPDGNHNLIVPSPKDIFMGRGRRTMTAPGNIRLYMVLDDNFDRYESSAKHEKSKIAKEMVDLMKSQGCRFLEQIDGFWFQVDDAKARNKISHDFRTLRSSKKSGAAGANGKTKGARTSTSKRSRP